MVGIECRMSNFEFGCKLLLLQSLPLVLLLPRRPGRFTDLINLNLSEPKSESPNNASFFPTTSSAPEMNAIRRTVSSQTKGALSAFSLSFPRTNAKMHFAGQYDFTLIPLQLPTALLSMLLEPIQCKPDGKGWTFCEHAELVEKGIEVEAPGDGLGWAVLHAGEHIKTGVQWLPGGAVTFYVSLLGCILHFVGAESLEALVLSVEDVVLSVEDVVTTLMMI